MAAIARAVAPDLSFALDTLDTCDERRWLERAAAEGSGERAALLSGISLVASLRGPTRHPERSFLSRVGHALDLPVDFAAIDDAHRRLGGGVRLGDRDPFSGNPGRYPHRDPWATDQGSRTFLLFAAALILGAGHLHQHDRRGHPALAPAAWAAP